MAATKIPTFTIRKPYDPRVRVVTLVGDTTLAKQSFKAECDINTIMAKYEKTGLIEHLNKHNGDYGDFTNVVDYQEALNIVRDAQLMFSELPSSVRIRFDNNPEAFLSFVQDPANADEMVEMGLAHAPTVQAPQEPFTAPAEPAAATEPQPNPAP